MTDAMHHVNGEGESALSHPPDVARVLREAKAAMCGASGPDAELAIIRFSAGALERLGDGGDGVGDLSDYAIDVRGIDADAVQHEISRGIADILDERAAKQKKAPKANGHKQKGRPRGNAGTAPRGGDSIEWPDVDKGRPMATCANARAAITALGIDCCYDKFHDRKLVAGDVIEQWDGELSDHACQMLRVALKERFDFDPGKENTSDAAVQLCLQNQFDPVCDYLDGLRWDGKSRLDTWMTTYMGATDTELTRAIGRLSLVAAVRRARQPGCKFDQVVVLEGPEGKGKSTAIQILAGPENFSDQQILGLGEREQQEAMRGVWLYEIGELSGMSKADVDKTKAFVSRQTDRARPAYGRHTVSQPRRCVFFATTNDDTYLKSQTGNRRWWPVKTEHISLASLAQDRDQLWAEAAAIEAGGATLTLPEELWCVAAVEQDRRRDHDPWEDILAKVQGAICDLTDGGGREERISTTDLFTLHLKLPADKCNDATAKRLAHCMRRLGWERSSSPIRILDQGKVRGFFRPAEEGGGTRWDT